MRAALIVFKKCVRKTYSGANYICRNEYIFSFYTN